MFGNTRMDTDQLNRCVNRHSFLSPRFSSPFSNYSQRTNCVFGSQSQTPSEIVCEKLSHNSSIFSPSNKSHGTTRRLFSFQRASCESNETTPTATDRMERAKEDMTGTDPAHPFISEVEIQNYLNNETGQDRLVKMFAKNYLGHYSPEIIFIKTVTMQSAGMTFLLMTFLSGRKAKQDFLDANTITVFKTRYQAFRHLNDRVFLYSAKEGAKWAMRVSLFSVAFLGISQTIAAYRNKSSPWEYAAAAGVTIGVMKANMGLRACLVGTGLGTVAGGVMGLLALGMMKALNETQEQRHYWQIQKELEKEKTLELKGNLPDTSLTDTA